MKQRRVMTGFNYLRCCALLAVLGCSAESAVVGGNDSGSDGVAGAAEEPGAGRLRRLLTGIRSGPGLCLPYQLPLDDDGTAACKVFTMSPAHGSSCDCDAPNRARVTDDARETVLEKAKLDQYCDQPEGPACVDECVCEDLEAGGDELASCLSGEDGVNDGWCYVDPAQGVGVLSTPCDQDPQAQIRFIGNANLAAEERGYLACSDAVEAAPQALGAPCVPSDEQSPFFSGFELGEVVVDMGSASCASGTCLVEGFQGRVTCPFGSTTSGGGDGACTLPMSSQRVLVPVRAQLVSRPPSIAATCSCRCAGPGDGPFCSCAAGQDCAPLVVGLGLPGDRFAGSYCVPRGAAAETPGGLTCADEPEQCGGDRPY